MPSRPRTSESANSACTTTQKVEGNQGNPGFQFPPGSPFEEFFKDFFERNRPPGGNQQNRPRRVTSLGSGFVIDKDGLIVTNNHVIAEAEEVSVTFPSGEKLPAKILGKDPKTDLALLKVEPKSPLPAVPWGTPAPRPCPCPGGRAGWPHGGPPRVVSP